MNMLDKIIENKRKAVSERKSLYPLKLLEKSIYFETMPVSLSKYLLRKDKSGVIAEYKTMSPSAGVLNPVADPGAITLGYMQAGASALSVLTDDKFFNGSFDDLRRARSLNYCPILQKDFIIDEYQVVEAKSVGADAILLIAAVLDGDDMIRLSSVAAKLGMEVVMEVHSEEELEFVTDNISVIGVNNRNLKTFITDISTSLDLANRIPEGRVRISESGIRGPGDMLQLRKAGYDGFLMGEIFMRCSDPAEKCRETIREFRKLCEMEILQ
jgi:indole-3-glycerol phosphate synthase